MYEKPKMEKTEYKIEYINTTLVMCYMYIYIHKYTYTHIYTQREKTYEEISLKRKEKKLDMRL